MKIRFAVLLAGVFFAAQVAAQEGYAFKRPILEARSGWARIQLPDEIYSKLVPGFRDIRIYGRNASGEAVEVPYVLRQLQPRRLAQIKFSIINRTRTGNTRFFTLETDPAQTVNRIELDLGRPNFDLKVKLEGSNDQSGWQTILDDYRITSISNELTRYSFTSLRFPDSKFRYFRISFDSKEDVKDIVASVARVESNPAAVRQFKVRKFTVNDDEVPKSSVVDIQLQNAVPVSSIHIRVAAGQDYYRKFEISYRTGTDRQGRDLFRNAGTGTLSSLDDEPFEFPEVVSDRFRVVVRNGDSPPLRFEEPGIFGRAYEIVVKFPQAGRYDLFYSNPKAAVPQYDLGPFAEKAPADLPVLNLGGETATGVRVGSAGLESRWWLWPVMAAAVLLILWFAFRLLKRSE